MSCLHKDIMIEREIEERVRFKMDGFRTVLKNTHDNICATMYNPNIPVEKIARTKQYLDYLQTILNDFDKEVRMGVPCDEMFKNNLYALKNECVEKIRDLFPFRDMVFHRDMRIMGRIAEIIEAALFEVLYMYYTSEEEEG